MTFMERNRLDSIYANHSRGNGQKITVCDFSKFCFSNATSLSRT